MAAVTALFCATATVLAQETAPAVATDVADAPGFFEILFSGGLIGIIMMLVLIGLSLTATYLVFEQIMTLRTKEIIPEGLSEDVRELLQAGKVAEAGQACRERSSVLAFVLLHGLAEIEGGWSAVESAVEDALAEQAARLFRKVEYLTVIGNLAPMVGLLGTVTGMLVAFQQVANTKGSAGAADLAEGIYQALVTTVVGLIIAIPALGAFAVLRNRVDLLVAEAAYAAQHAFAPLKRRRVTRPSSASSAPPPPPAEGGR
jgi:biopolymer transport protein ExbB